MQDSYLLIGCLADPCQFGVHIRSISSGVTSNAKPQDRYGCADFQTGYTYMSTLCNVIDATPVLVLGGLI
jgi:hypothetical protein